MKVTKQASVQSNPSNLSKTEEVGQRAAQLKITQSPATPDFQFQTQEAQQRQNEQMKQMDE